MTGRRGSKGEPQPSELAKDFLRRHKGEWSWSALYREFLDYAFEILPFMRGAGEWSMYVSSVQTYKDQHDPTPMVPGDVVHDESPLTPQPKSPLDVASEWELNDERVKRRGRTRRFQGPQTEEEVRRLGDAW